MYSSEYVADELVENSDDDKHLFKADVRAAKKMNVASKQKSKKPGSGQRCLLPGAGIAPLCYVSHVSYQFSIHIRC